MNRTAGNFLPAKLFFRTKRINDFPVPLFPVLRICVLLFVLGCGLVTGIPAQAEDQAGSSPANWEISVKPKPTPEEIERGRWSAVFANDIGLYEFDNKSLKLDEEDKQQVQVLVKVTFTDPKIIDSLSEKYKAKLSAGDKVACSEIQMVFRIRQKTYAVTESRVFSDQGTVLAETRQAARFVPVPVKTFADSMYEIARHYERNE